MRSRSSLWVLTCGTLLSLPVLSLGFVNDDFIHRLALGGASDRYRRGAFSLYDFLRGGKEAASLMDTGLLPWFAEPALTARFFRPLSSALLAADSLVFGEHALPAHLHSLAWFALAVVLVWKIHQALLPQRAAFFATLVFTVAGAHVETTSWIAARHMLVGGVFGLSAWYAEIRRAECGERWLALAGSGCLCLGFLASESTLCAVPFVLGQAWFAGGRPKDRLFRALPTALLTLSYLVAYGLAGFGTRNTGGYVSPLEAPARFALTVAERLPLLAAELFTSLPAVLSYAGDAARRVFFVLGCLSALLVVGVALRRARTLPDDRARALSWIPWATAASLVPVCGTILDGRLLLVPMVGSSMLVGALLSRVGSPAVDGMAARALRSLGVFVLFALHLGLSPFVRVVFALNYRELGRIQAELPERARLACDARARLLVVNGSDPTIGMYGAALFYRSGVPERRGWHVLSMAQNDIALERTGARAFVLQTLGARRAHFIEEFYRPRHDPLRAGAVVQLASMRVTVLETSPLGPTRVLFELDSDPGGPENCIARWVGGAEGHLESLSLPASGAVRVRYEPGPMGL